jgi:dihydroorotate dehydrogenase
VCVCNLQTFISLSLSELSWCFWLTQSSHKDEVGGLSGTPVFDRSTSVLSDLYRFTQGKIPLIGVGGVASGQDAYRKIRAGASLVQLYSALTYAGPVLIPRIKADLAALLRRDGFASASHAVGADHVKR